jgi:hypothetical protein
MAAGRLPRQLQIGFSLSGCLLKRNFPLAGMKHFRWGVEKDDHVRAGEESANESG